MVLGSKIAPIFFNTVEDSGALPVECPVDQMNMGDVIVIKPYAGVVENEAGEVISEFSLKTQVLLDEVKAGGRIPLIIGRSLTERAREALGLGPSEAFRRPWKPQGTAAPVSPWRRRSSAALAAWGKGKAYARAPTANCAWARWALRTRRAP